MQRLRMKTQPGQTRDCLTLTEWLISQALQRRWVFKPVKWKYHSTWSLLRTLQSSNWKAVENTRKQPIRGFWLVGKGRQSARRVDTCIISGTHFPLLSAPVMSNVKKDNKKSTLWPGLRSHLWNARDASGTNLNSWTLQLDRSTMVSRIKEVVSRLSQVPRALQMNSCVFYSCLWEGKTCLTGFHAKGAKDLHYRCSTDKCVARVQVGIETTLCCSAYCFWATGCCRGDCFWQPSLHCFILVGF